MGGRSGGGGPVGRVLRLGRAGVFPGAPHIVTRLTVIWDNRCYWQSTSGENRLRQPRRFYPATIADRSHRRVALTERAHHATYATDALANIRGGMAEW